VNKYLQVDGNESILMFESAMDTIDGELNNAAQEEYVDGISN